MKSTSYKEILEEREPQMMVLEFGYSKKYVLPHENGMAILDLLNKCEVLHEEYSKPHRIEPIDMKESFRISVMGISEYKRIKLEQLVFGDNYNDK